MAKYLVYGLVTASVLLGTYEAKSKEDAISKAESDNSANWNPSVCHECADEIDIGDIYETQAEELPGT